MIALDPCRAAGEARAIAQGWTEAGGPGGAIVLFGPDGVLEGFGGGFASLETRTPFTPDTPNRWASISKQFCTATVLLEGLDLAAPLGSLVAELPEAVGGVTLGQALDMTGGLPDLMETLSLAGLPSSASITRAEAFDAIRRLPGINGVPGAEMTYTNTGYRLVQHVFPEQRGRSYAELLRERLLRPLGLEAIRFPEDESEPVADLATGYWHDGSEWRRGRYGLQYSPSGGLAGSAATLALWGAALMTGHGPLEGMLVRLTSAREPLGGFYRLGLNAPDLASDVPLFGHGGSLPGYKDHILLSPSLGLGVVVLCNREDADPLWNALRIVSAWTGRALPVAARLPAGLYAAESGPFWAEAAGDTITFMGTTDRLFADGAGGVRTLPAYLEASLRAEADGTLRGHVGRMAQHLLPVPPGLALDPSLAGEWRDEAYGARLSIRADGSAELPGIPGPRVTLTPLPGGRALASRTHNGSTMRICFYPVGEGRLRLASHRSRVLEFRRA